jgi:2-polyprenyl-3-methyl-5-hydroxy-6-metoxy-1,4-benzoquinol methylase
MPLPARGLEQHYDLNADEYFQHHDVDNKGRIARELLNQGALLTGGKGRVLDVGVGRGELLRIAKEEGWQAVGIEPSPSFAEYARKHSGAEVLCEPVEESNLPSEGFDVVILSAVLEHLYQPDETVKRLAQALRPGGALFVDVPNEAGLYFKMGNFYEKACRRDWTVNLAPTFSPFHVFGFNPSALRALLSKHNLKVAKWHVYPGRSVLPNTGGIVSAVERLAAHTVTAVSRIGSLGTYIEAWAIKNEV